MNSLHHTRSWERHLSIQIFHPEHPPPRPRSGIGHLSYSAREKCGLWGCPFQALPPINGGYGCKIIITCVHGSRSSLRLIHKIVSTLINEHYLFVHLYSCAIYLFILLSSYFALLVLPGSRARIVRCGGRYDPQLVKRSSE